MKSLGDLIIILRGRNVFLGPSPAAAPSATPSHTAAIALTHAQYAVSTESWGFSKGDELRHS